MNVPIRMYATSWGPGYRSAREYLRERQMPFAEIDIEAHAEAAEFVPRVNSGKRKVPTLILGERIEE